MAKKPVPPVTATEYLCLVDNYWDGLIWKGGARYLIPGNLPYLPRHFMLATEADEKMSAGATLESLWPDSETWDKQQAADLGGE